jgi:hypothetical protein
LNKIFTIFIDFHVAEIETLAEMSKCCDIQI